MSQMGRFSTGGGGGGSANTFNADFGTAVPLAGVIDLLGGNNIVTNAGGNTVTFNVTDNVTLAGYLQADGDITSTMGLVDAATTVTAGTGITATTGDIHAIQGDIVADAGDLELLDGNIILGASSGDDGQIPIAITGVGNVAWANITAGANIAIANGPNTITISSSTAPIISVTQIDDTDSPYVVLLTDYYISADVTGGIIAVHLPAAPPEGTAFIIKDAVGMADVNNITVTALGGTTIDTVAAFVMNTQFEVSQFIFVTGLGYQVF